MLSPLVLFSLACAVLADQPPSDVDRAWAQLQGTPAEQRKAVDFTLAHSDATPSALMFVAAAKALGLGRLEDGGFLFYAAQLRSRLDLQRFPPIEKGGDSPGIALAAVRHEVGAAVNPAVMREPRVFKAVIERVRAWDLRTAAGYDPGWKYAAAMPETEARALAETQRRDYLKPADGLVTLLNTPEYFEAWKTVQDANLGPYDGKPHPERIAAREQAEKRGRQIEEKMGIEGPFSLKPSPPQAPVLAPTGPHPEPGALGRQQATAQLKKLGYPRPDDATQFVGSALQGEADVVRLFLAAGMPVDAPNHLGDHAFLMAIQGSYIDLAAELLKAGADPNLADQNGTTPLIELGQFCDETTLVAAVIKAGGNVNARSRSGRTPLKSANTSGCTEITRILKKAGAVQ